MVIESNSHPYRWITVILFNSQLGVKRLNTFLKGISPNVNVMWCQGSEHLPIYYEDLPQFKVILNTSKKFIWMKLGENEVGFTDTSQGSRTEIQSLDTDKCQSQSTVVYYMHLNILDENHVQKSTMIISNTYISLNGCSNLSQFIINQIQVSFNNDFFLVVDKPLIQRKWCFYCIDWNTLWRCS